MNPLKLGVPTFKPVYFHCRSLRIERGTRDVWLAQRWAGYYLALQGRKAQDTYVWNFWC
jgi:hypothetical protein